MKKPLRRFFAILAVVICIALIPIHLKIVDIKENGTFDPLYWNWCHNLRHYMAGKVGIMINSGRFTEQQIIELLGVNEMEVEEWRDNKWIITNPPIEIEGRHNIVYYMEISSSRYQKFVIVINEKGMVSNWYKMDLSW